MLRSVIFFSRTRRFFKLKLLGTEFSEIEKALKRSWTRSRLFSIPETYKSCLDYLIRGYIHPNLFLLSKTVLCSQNLSQVYFIKFCFLKSSMYGKPYILVNINIVIEQFRAICLLKDDPLSLIYGKKLIVLHKK